MTSRALRWACWLAVSALLLASALAESGERGDAAWKDTLTASTRGWAGHRTEHGTPCRKVGNARNAAEPASSPAIPALARLNRMPDGVLRPAVRVRLAAIRVAPSGGGIGASDEPRSAAWIGHAGTAERRSEVGVNPSLRRPARGAAYQTEGAEAPGSGPGASRREVRRWRGAVQSRVESPDPRRAAGPVQAVNQSWQQSPAASPLVRQVRSGDVLRMTVGAYDGCVKCTGYWVGGVLLYPPTGRTALGPRPRGNHTASCPPEFPLGTWIEIAIKDYWPLGQRRRCEDRGDAIRMFNGRVPYGRPVGKLEVYIAGSHEDALEFAGGRGVVPARVEVLR